MFRFLHLHLHHHLQNPFHPCHPCHPCLHLKNLNLRQEDYLAPLAQLFVLDQPYQRELQFQKLLHHHFLLLRHCLPCLHQTYHHHRHSYRLHHSQSDEIPFHYRRIHRLRSQQSLCHLLNLNLKV